jgi:hypothetical protein
MSVPIRGHHIIAASLLFCSSGLHAESENKQQAFVLPQTISSLPAAIASKRRLYLDVFEQRAREQIVPAELVDAVALGFQGNRAQLADADTNIRYGVQYLAGAVRQAGGDLCRALMKYRAGYGEEAMSARSVEYCRRVRDHLAALGSPLATLSIPLPTVLPDARVATVKPTSRTAGGTKTRPANPAERSRQFWAAHEARVRAMTFAIRAKWARLAQQKRG